MFATCPITDANVGLYRIPGRTVRARCRGLPELILVMPDCAAAYWELQLPSVPEGQVMRLGNLAEFSPKRAKQLARALLRQPRRTPEDGPTLKSFLQRYSQEHLPHLSPGYQRAVRSYSRRLVEAFGEEPLAWICHRAVAAWHAKYSRHSPGAAHAAKNLLRSVINLARDWGVLAPSHPNPCEGLPRNRPGPGNRPFSARELAALGAALAEEEKNPRYRAQAQGLALTLFSGGRPGEIRTLDCSSVVSIDGQPSHLQLPHAKAGPRCVELNTDAAAVLADQLKAGKSGPVFASYKHPDRPYSEWQALNFWRRVVRKAQLPKESRQYWLRHTFGSNVLLAGGTMMAASALLGHSSPSMTRRYIHIPSQETIAAGERIGERIAGWLGLHDWLQTLPPADNMDGPLEARSR